MKSRAILLGTKYLLLYGDSYRVFRTWLHDAGPGEADIGLGTGGAAQEQTRK